MEDYPIYLYNTEKKYFLNYFVIKGYIVIIITEVEAALKEQLFWEGKTKWNMHRDTIAKIEILEIL